MYIILLNGHVGCLKTTLSYLISSRLNFGLVSTSTMGEFTSDRKNEHFIVLRNIRYERLKFIAESYLDNDVSVVLDGNFPHKNLRTQIYDLAKKHNVKDVVSLKCICSNVNKLYERLEYRKQNKGVPDSNANDISSYWGSVDDYEDINNDIYLGRKLSRIIFDSGEYKFEVVNSNDKIVTTLAEKLQDIIDSNILEKPLF